MTSQMKTPTMQKTFEIDRRLPLHRYHNVFSTRSYISKQQLRATSSQRV